MTDYNVTLNDGEEQTIRNGPKPTGGWKKRSIITRDDGDRVIITLGAVTPPPDPEPPPPSTDIPPGAIKTWTFDGTTLPPEWGWDMAMVGITDQPMNKYAMFRADPSLIEVSNGTLKVKARRNADGSWDQSYISTRGKWSRQYGIYRAKMRFSGGHALWPAFWMLDPTQYHENDIIEAYPEPGNAHYTMCFPGKADCKTIALPSDYSTAFHVYEMEWRNNVAIARLDGVEKARTTVPVLNSQFLLFQQAVGVWFKNYAPDNTTPANPQLEVEWVGVWA